MAIVDNLMVMGSKGKSMARSPVGIVDEEEMILVKMLFLERNLRHFIGNNNCC